MQFKRWKYKHIQRNDETNDQLSNPIATVSLAMDEYDRILTAVGTVTVTSWSPPLLCKFRLALTHLHHLCQKMCVLVFRQNWAQYLGIAYGDDKIRPYLLVGACTLIVTCWRAWARANAPFILGKFSRSQTIGYHFSPFLFGGDTFLGIIILKYSSLHTYIASKVKVDTSAVGTRTCVYHRRTTKQNSGAFFNFQRCFFWHSTNFLFPEKVTKTFAIRKSEQSNLETSTNGFFIKKREKEGRASFTRSLLCPEKRRTMLKKTIWGISYM